MIKSMIAASLALAVLPVFADVWDCGDQNDGKRFTDSRTEAEKRGCARLEVAAPEYPSRQEISRFQRQLKIGDRSQLGLVVEIRNPVVKVQPARGLERWYRIEELEPPPRPAKSAK